MKRKIRKIVQLTIIVLFIANIAVLRAAEPEIVLDYVPQLGEMGCVEGRVVWEGINDDNAEEYAIIAMLTTVWGSYVKPYWDKYLNELDDEGYFSTLITTHPNDADVDVVNIYFVKRSDINFTDPSWVNPSTMAGRFLAHKMIRRSEWINPPPAISCNIAPGFVDAGTEIKLTTGEEGVIRYTLDGSNPMTSVTAQTYNNNVFTVPAEGALLIKAVVDRSGAYSRVFSFLWFPKEPLKTSFFGLNVSLALNGEPFGHPLSEEATRERMKPVARLTQWIRTFSTHGNGNEYINQIAKELGLRTMIGVYISGDESKNKEQIEGLRQILLNGPPPDLISVGNELSLTNVKSKTIAACIDAVREMVLELGLTIPIGSVDIANISWSTYVFKKIDFAGINIYAGTWDATPENQMLEVTKQIYERSLQTFKSKLVLMTEVGTPYAGSPYNASGVTQTPSITKAVNYLCGFLDWIQKEQLPSFYFEAYDEPTKKQTHPIEQYFGIMDGNLQIHSFYRTCVSPIIPTYVAIKGIDEISPDHPLKVWVRNGNLHVTGIVPGETLSIYSATGALVYHSRVTSDEEVINMMVSGVYIVRSGNQSMKALF